MHTTVEDLERFLVAEVEQMWGRVEHRPAITGSDYLVRLETVAGLLVLVAPGEVPTPRHQAALALLRDLGAAAGGANSEQSITTFLEDLNKRGGDVLVN